ncbi:MAG: dihydrolipoyllysine-residue succinyltransferase [Proteobacteria bacterium]|nr:dihydrolipoyllysine-residue succinyltransferase [Pseudomonadota bacterium]
MMLVDVKAPMLSESMTDARLLVWQKKTDDFVEQGENLVDVETDKVILDLPAPVSGKLVEILAPDAATVGSEEVIARIDTSAQPDAIDVQQPENTVDSYPEKPGNNKLEKGARVQKKEAEPEKKQAVPVQPVAQPVGGHVALAEERPMQRVPMTRLRQRIAERMLIAKRDYAILTTFNEINMKSVLDLRIHYQDSFGKTHGVKLGLMSFFVKAVVAGLKKFPVMNASIEGEDILYHGYYDIGVAVSAPRGLVVPVIKNADLLSFAEIEKNISKMSQLAQSGELSMDILTGGTFTISNGGVYGSLLSTPIVNPPQSAILGMHRIQDRVVVESGEMVVRPMMNLALSYDHRLIDGRDAVEFLVYLKEQVEAPERLLLDI